MKHHRIVTHLKDSELTEVSYTLQRLFVEYLPQFEAFDPSLNMAFATAWKASIIALDGHPNDENTVDQLQDYTQLLNEATERALSHINGLEYFITQAYPGKEYKLAEFGLNMLPRKRKNNFAEMVDLCFIIHELVMDFEADLLAAGMPPAFPGQMLTAIQAMDAAMRRQEKFKLKRLALTNQRINLFNHLYDTYRQVAKAARSIFHNNPTEMNMFTKL